MQRKPELRLAEELVAALNFMKMQVGMYPDGHHIVARGVDRVMGVLEEIFAVDQRITIHVEDDALCVGEDFLDKKSRYNQQFAKWLNDLFLTSITLSKGVTSDDLLKFQDILAMKTSDIQVLGSVEKLFAENRIEHIRVKGYDLSSFGSTNIRISGPERRISESERRTSGSERRTPGSERGTPGSERRILGSERRISGLERRISGIESKISEPERLRAIRTDGPGPDLSFGSFRFPEPGIADRETPEDQKPFEDEAWQEFISSLVAQSSEKGKRRPRLPEPSDIDSQEFVKRLNEEAIDWDVFLDQYRSMITQYFRSGDEGKKAKAAKLISGIDSLVGSFHPDLKQRMFSIAGKEISVLPPSIIKTDNLKCFDYETVTGILRCASDDKRGISPSLSLLFQKLSKTQDFSSDGSERGALDGSSLTGVPAASAKEIEKLIEREKYEDYVPADYGEILKRQSTGTADGGKMNGEGFSIEEHIANLEDANLNLQISRLFLALLDENPDEDEYREISLFITRGISEFVLLGHFSFLIEVLDTYRRHAGEKPSKAVRKIADSGAAVFRDADALARDLKPFFRRGVSMNSLVDFVAACGARNCPWLLDVYLETGLPRGQAMIVEVLRHFREEAVSNVLNGLPKAPAHAIRKFLVLLQLIGDAGVVPSIAIFTGHPNPAVRLEAIRALLRFEAQDAAGLLQKAAFSKDPSESSQAIVIAFDCGVADLCVKLIARINTVLIRNRDLAANELIVAEAVKTRNPQLLPHLERVAGARWSLSPGRLSLTKKALVDAIGLHEPPNAGKLVRMCLSSGSKQIRDVCAELMKKEGE